ncbi:cell division cycle- protein [Agyrium rufum]|nr:cell division cycle- protein [Agyrium rufum]
MDRSSPLAAMQPSSLPFGHWGMHRGQPIAFEPIFGKDISCAAGVFNIGDLGFKKAPVDYFSLKPAVRGSSPTSSLAVDLSQNFHIDKSPQLPTPRRSLFSSNFLNGCINVRESTLTPPIPTSSPCPVDESMDISPLPHKTPFVVSSTIPLESPTPIASANISLLSSPLCIPETPVPVAKPAAPFERRRPTILRPSLSRIKAQSSGALQVRSAGLENPFSSFKFGSNPLSTGTTLDPLAECFMESPPPRPLSISSTTNMPPPKPRFPLSSAVPPSNRHNASPSASNIRRANNPMQRPRKQFRRSLSMFEHPAEVMKPKEEPIPEMPAMMDVDDVHKQQLPHFFSNEESIPRITKEVMVDVLHGKYSEHFDRSVIVDCRFEYEYRGGHIEGAINFNNKEELATKLLQEHMNERTLLILHCEYSAHRAPIAARHVRYQDRATNSHQYPKLTFPEIYILDGGYSAFYKDHRDRCFPQNYIEMNDKAHSVACERGLGRIKQQRAKLCRAQTFAFGQHALDDSPSSSGRSSTFSTGSCGDLVSGMNITVEPSLDLNRSIARRLASY